MANGKKDVRIVLHLNFGDTTIQVVDLVKLAALTQGEDATGQLSTKDEELFHKLCQVAENGDSKEFLRHMPEGVRYVRLPSKPKNRFCNGMLKNGVAVGWPMSGAPYVASAVEIAAATRCFEWYNKSFHEDMECYGKELKSNLGNFAELQALLTEMRCKMRVGGLQYYDIGVAKESSAGQILLRALETLPKMQGELKNFLWRNGGISNAATEQLQQLGQRAIHGASVEELNELISLLMGEVISTGFKGKLPVPVRNGTNASRVLVNLALNLKKAGKASPFFQFEERGSCAA